MVQARIPIYLVPLKPWSNVDCPEAPCPEVLPATGGRRCSGAHRWRTGSWKGKINGLESGRSTVRGTQTLQFFYLAPSKFRSVFLHPFDKADACRSDEKNRTVATHYRCVALKGKNMKTLEGVACYIMSCCVGQDGV